MGLLGVIYQNGENLLSEVKDLLDKGENPNIITEYAESPLRVASNNGRFDVIRLLLDNGADESQLEWSDIFFTLAYGTHDELKALTKSGCDLEARDFWERTPFLFSILIGDIEKTRILIEAGADFTVTGRCNKPALFYAIQKDDIEVLNWLIEQGFDIEGTDQFFQTPLMEAVEHNAVKSVQALVDAGADIFKQNHCTEKAIALANSLEIVNILLDAGEDINDIDKEVRAVLFGTKVDEAPDISEEEYKKGRHRVFGKSNPELSHNRFWYAMVKCGGSAWHARSKFGDEVACDGTDKPIWCFDRFGKSITPLDDGRFIEIAGEHEDHYDPDFCIYNDVFVHEDEGECKIYTYPREVFPPTDFHTATLVGKHIYIIGNLGYDEDRKPGYTPVYRLDIESMKIERVGTGGEMPGWISRHKAKFDGKSVISITGGDLIENNDDGEELYIANKKDYSLNLDSLEWTRKNS